MSDSVKQENKPVLVRASARSIHISPRKMRLVTNLVKDMRASDAVIQLGFTNKKAAKYLSDLIASAVANAQNNFSLQAENLFVKSVSCDMGQTMKRYFPRARGSAFVIRRKMSHVNIILEERPGKASAKKGNKGNAAVLKSAKKDKPLVTQEGSIGKPGKARSRVVTSKASVSEHKTTHHENDEATINEKENQENQIR